MRLELKAHCECDDIIRIGRVVENEVTEVEFDFSQWQEEYGAGIATLLVLRNHDANPYPVVLTIEDGKAQWTITDADTAVFGRGCFQLKYVAGTKVKMSKIFQFNCGKSLTGEGDAPDPYEDWLDTLTDLGALTTTNAQTAQAAATSAQASAESAAESATAAGVAQTAAEAAKEDVLEALDGYATEDWAEGSFYTKSEVDEIVDGIETGGGGNYPILTLSQQTVIVPCKSDGFPKDGTPNIEISLNVYKGTEKLRITNLTGVPNLRNGIYTIPASFASDDTGITRFRYSTANAPFGKSWYLNPTVTATDGENTYTLTSPFAIIGVMDGSKGDTGSQGPKGDKGDTGATGPAGSDASVTAANIASALGYLPANPSAIPTKTSDLINDSGFLTQHQSLSGYATETWVQSQGYLTQHQSLSAYALKSEIPTVTNDFTDAYKNKVDSLWADYQSAITALG